jgi:hypothetical protein
VANSASPNLEGKKASPSFHKPYCFAQNYISALFSLHGAVLFSSLYTSLAMPVDASLDKTTEKSLT